MKIKSIIVCGFLLLGVGTATTSCEDMLTADNNLVTTDLAPQDTVYQMMGIVQRMQKLADRTILLGEVRADLVDVDPIHASADIQELANNNVSENNIYNSPAEYYAVINSCNIYLAYVDSLYQVYGDYYYRKEVIATKCFRAWCYLELTKIYGEVPFVTEPVLTAESADRIVAGSKSDMLSILDYVIRDLEPYAKLPENDNLRPSYGATFADVSARKLFLPVRVMLGELYLWRGSAKGKDAGYEDFINAIRMYHDYFNFPNEAKSAGNNYVNEWLSASFNGGRLSSYASCFLPLRVLSDNVYAAVLPLDTTAYYGNTSDLRALFNSTYSNNYYAPITPSDRIKNISQSQDYCYRSFDSDISHYAPKDKAELDNNEFLIGDLRLQSIYTSMSNSSGSQYNSGYSETMQHIRKWTGGNSILTDDKRNDYIFYYRTNILYLHLAEALNLAGFPETAFAVLAYGLRSDVFKNEYLSYRQSDNTVVNIKVISDYEFNKLCDIKSYFSASADDYMEANTSVYTEEEIATKMANAANSFVIWPSNYYTYMAQSRNNGIRNVYRTDNFDNRLVQMGIHSIGCGDTEFNEKYRLYIDQETIDKLQYGSVIPPTIPKYQEPKQPVGGYVEGREPLSMEEWTKALELEGDATRPTNSNYERYKTEYNEYPAKVQAAVDDYNKSLVEYKATLEIYNSDKEILANDELRRKRQNQVRWLILQEEALEGAFEGTRFYDLLRYQMQDGKVGGVAATIEMPDSVRENYGETPNMTNKPWYLPLPTR